MSKTIHLPSSVRTRGVALPRAVESEVMAEQAQLHLELHRVAARLNHYNNELRQIDENLSVVMAAPNTTVMGLKPNYYHLVRMRPGHPAWIKPVENDDGTYRELDSRIFDQVAEADMWNDRTQKVLREKSKRAEEARQRQVLRERMDRAHEFDERWHSANNLSIRVPKAVKVKG